MKLYRIVVLLLLSALAAWVVTRFAGRKDEAPAGTSGTKLYWFIPDGMRADPDLFDIFEWARQGKLPNIKRMMDQGTYGFCKPTFPSHTPTNFATLFTGSYPEVHGVNDGPMHTEGSPLSKVSVGGFRSTAKLVEPIWSTLEARAGLKVALLSVPGSTPPELRNGITIRGRWGGWGADFHAVNFEDKGDLSKRREQGRAARLFFFGPPLTRYVETVPADPWAGLERTFSPVKEVEMTAWGATVYGAIQDRSDDGKTSYDTISFAVDRGSEEKEIVATLRQGEWSDWIPITLEWRVSGSDRSRDVDTSFRIKVIKLDADGFFRVRLLYDNINKYVTSPEWVAGEVLEGVGPMVDFVDNFPPQLIFYQEDKAAFLEEAHQSLDWHREAVAFVLDKYEPDVLINDIYTPNQMLTSRWWMGYVDPASSRYGEVSEADRTQLWSEVHGLYVKLDEIVGKLLAKADENTVVVLSSDHGAVPLDRWVRLNNFFAREGLLYFEIDGETGEPIIDWGRTTAVYLKMAHVYVNPNGLGGQWKRPSGPEYEALRKRVETMLRELEDESGVQPVVKVAAWEDARKEFRLLEDRAGDLIVANRPGFGWSEEMTADLEVFARPLKTGYKQAVLAENAKGMWTPFVIMGPGVKKGHFLGDDPIDMGDQYPTLLRLLNVKTPSFVQGKAIEGVFE